MVISLEPQMPHMPRSISPDIPTGRPLISFWTPKSSHDIQQQIEVIPYSARCDPWVRQLFSKISKGLDTKNVTLALQEANIGELESEITRLRPRKRQKVIPDPNSRFIRIDDIQRSRIRLEEALNAEDVSWEAQNADL